MQIKEIEINNKGKHISTKIHMIAEDELISETKTIFEYDEFPDLPFASDDNYFVNGFSNNVYFEDSELINGEYVVERTGTSHQTGNPHEPYFETNNKTFFNKKEQIIRIEENGNYENFIQTFIYDDEGNLIEEKVNNKTNGFLPYDDKVIYVYDKRYNERLKKEVCLLQYAKYDEHEEVFYSYTRFGDLMVEFNRRKEYSKTKLNENQYFYNYDENGNWITKKHFENGTLVATHEREYGNFSEYFKKDEIGNDLPF